MTEPSDNTATRPISVAELLAKNGNIGAPAPGGRRRRRRGNADAVTVAELTGEIPIIRLDEASEPVVAEPPTAAETPVDEPAGQELEEPQAATPEAEPEAEEPEAEASEAEAADTVEAAAVEAATDEVAPVEATPRRHAHLLKKQHAPHPPSGGAEEMTFDPLLDDLDEDEAAEDEGDTVKTRPSYLKSPADTLFGGDSVADDAARRDLGDTQKVAIDVDEPLDEAGASDHESEQSPFLRGFWIVVQSVLAVALGAGLFIAFDQLWKWNNIVALALSVLVILGLVVGVRVVRKTEDIASTLIAVAVGAMVTLGPLALLQST
ncbi:hypothetical protein [Mycolicibacterium diernhoferi]|uniref:FUSC family protein n=1 Tax=Mycolicibacterium diernhoferi TaxID=1801 RepID=A0A1Q4HCE2_9MYCO|nr:hypothetical protein [Mycolicibacterium diernhoferi]OJZ65219.1 hypothetical protein BRW64_15505 [Mycolicibacterium diernhoferi]OPE55090.1 hypothetical protein BV510_06920 [Mycolicibacterium diernhoferi]PEG55152.1 hypothetical protein CRI78_08110 [Mycolicibacterium diernhoferi]QYL23564.1 hypothetical protein K0O62_04340 [Mycolicibacterium diernhoferi]